MATKTNPIPSHYRRVTPALIVKGAAKAIDFYTKVFGAKERLRFPGPEGTIVHAEVEIGDSVLIVEEAAPYMGTQAPPNGGLEGSPVFQYIYVSDVDATIKRAVELGATLKRAAENQFYGDRDGYIIDPFGHSWTISTHIEDVPPEEMARRMNALLQGGKQ